MKKLFIPIMACAMLVAFSSCKKDRTCSCTYTDTAPGSTSMTYDVTIVKAKKGDAKSACIKTTSEYTSGGQTYVQTSDCKLK